MAAVLHLPTHKVADVVVVGAGLCGLALTSSLVARGLDVTLLEARDRIGGRVLTRTDAQTGQALDLGAAWYWPETEPRISALLGELGLATLAQHDPGDTLWLTDPNRQPERREAALKAFAEGVAARAAAAPDQYRRHLTRLLSSQQHELLTQRALLATVDRVYSESLAQIDALLPALDAADAAVAQGQHALTPQLLAPFAGWNKGLMQAALAFNASSCALSNFAQDQVPDAETQRAITLDLAAAWREFAIGLNARLLQAQPAVFSA